jgi:uncharacterized protein
MDPKVTVDIGQRSATARRFDRPAVAGVAVERDVTVTARDGTLLSADIYHPLDWDQQSYPGLLAVSGYQKAVAGLPVLPTYPFRETGPIEWYVKRGYVYVLADVRGTGESSGQWAMQGIDEQNDLYDMVEWIAGRPWCTGKIGMIGQSYYGLVQWLAAATQPPHLTCIAPYDALVDHYRDSLFHGGIPCNFAAEWDRVLRANHVWGPQPDLPLRFATNPVDACLMHPLDDEFWQERAAFPNLGKITIPVLSVGNWGKNSLHARGNILGYEMSTGVRRLRMQAGAQPPSLNVAKALLDFEAIELHEQVLAPWYDYWLRGIDNGVLDGPPVSVFVSGVDEDRAFAEWPPAEAEDTSFYLAAGTEPARFSLNDGALESEPPQTGAVAYEYPDPLWHLGTATVTSLGIPNPVARVLTFSTAALTEDMQVVGCPRLELLASSDQLDTDFIVKVSDVAPRPDHLHPELPTPATIVTKGWLRASHRRLDPVLSTDRRPYHTHRDPEPIEPAVIYQFLIELMPLAHVFRRGHGIRVDIANGDSPVTDAIFSHYYGLKAGADTIHFGAEYPSRLVLPVSTEKAQTHE